MFKVGDYVKLKGPFLAQYKGRIAKIIRFTHNRTFPILVRFSGSSFVNVRASEIRTLPEWYLNRANFKKF